MIIAKLFREVKRLFARNVQILLRQRQKCFELGVSAQLILQQSRNARGHVDGFARIKEQHA